MENAALGVEEAAKLRCGFLAHRWGLFIEITLEVVTTLDKILNAISFEIGVVRRFRFVNKSVLETGQLQHAIHVIVEPLEVFFFDRTIELQIDFVDDHRPAILMNPLGVR